MHRGVRISPAKKLGPLEGIQAAVLRAGPGAVVFGLSAAFLHGVTWYDDESPIEICRNSAGQGRHRGGVRVHRSDLAPADVTTIDGLRVTTPIRTAYDLGRRPPRWRALGHLDDLVKSTGLDVKALWRYVAAHPDTRGIRQIRALIPHIDPASESPPESWMRLLIVEGGLPRPESQIAVHDSDGVEFARLDLGYRRFKLGIEFDGVEFHSSIEQKLHDEQRDRRLARLGWTIIRVTAERLREYPQDLVDEIETALRACGAYR
jgi:hypothetical protein